MGTALFGKVYRIVTKWYGAPVDDAFGDAIDAWKCGYFDRKYVFDEPDPGSLPAGKGASDAGGKLTDDDDARRSANSPDNGTPQDKKSDDPNKAGIRIDLTGIGVSKPK
ncbi:hypothetical protein ACVJGD_008167 [Bradyrhizobium sp. USDA 10063]